MKDRPVVFVDAYGLMIRHYAANPAISMHGHHVGGVVGFLKSIRWLADKFLPEDIYIVWESGGSAKRRSIYPDYKNRRRPINMNKHFDVEIPDSYKNRNYQLV